MLWQAWIPSTYDTSNVFVVISIGVLILSALEPTFNPTPELPKPPGQLGSYPGTTGNVGFILHFYGGLGYSVSGALQFVPPLRQYFPKAHRVVGYFFYIFLFITLCGNLVLLFGRTAFLKGGISSFIAAAIFVNPWWIYTAVRSLRAILRGSVHEHHIYMIRVVAVSLGNALVPPGDSIIKLIVQGVEPQYSYATSFWFGFTIAIIAGEICIALVYPNSKSTSPLIAYPNTSNSTIAPADATKFSSEISEEFAPWTELSLIKKEHSGNYFTLVFEAPFAVTIPPTHHVTFKDPEKLNTFKPYTPISTHGKEIEFLIKRYDKGSMSQYMTALEVGNRVKVCGPFGIFQLRHHSHLLLLAAGTGITPMISIIKHAVELSHLESKTKLIFFNQQEILHNRISEFKLRFPDKFDYEFVQNRASFNVQYVFEKHNFGRRSYSYTGSNASVLVCGPPHFCDDMVLKATESKIPRSDIFVFGFNDR
jgi:ferredoxin-NADP reductase